MGGEEEIERERGKAGQEHVEGGKKKTNKTINVGPERT